MSDQHIVDSERIVTFTSAHITYSLLYKVNIIKQWNIVKSFPNIYTDAI